MSGPVSSSDEGSGAFHAFGLGGDPDRQHAFGMGRRGRRSAPEVGFAPGFLSISRGQLRESAAAHGRG